MTDASEMLAAALEQMDGIIAGSKTLDYTNGLFDCQSPNSPYIGGLRVLHLVEDLRGLLELMESEEKDGLRCQIPDSTAELLGEWLQSHLTNGHLSVTGDPYQDRLARLEGDKESLVLQVSVLTDQVEAQGEKIRDLECCLDEHREKLNGTEEMLQQELLSRTSLETQKLDLMAEVSNLKLKLNTMEKDRLEYEERYKDTEGLFQEVNDLRVKVVEMENEKLQFEKKLKSTKDELVQLKEQLEQKDTEVKRLCSEMSYKTEIDESDSGAEESYKKKLKEKNLEVHKMKKAVESLMAANEEKDRKIEELRQSLNRYKKVQDMVMSVAHKKVKEGDSDESLNGGSAGVNASETLEMELASTSPTPAAEGVPEAEPVEIHTSILHVPIPVVSSTPKSHAQQVDKKMDAEVETTSDIGEIQPGDISSLVEETVICDSPILSDVHKFGSQENLRMEEEHKKLSMEPAQQSPLENKACMEISKFTSLPPKSPTGHQNSPDDESAASKKARASFGRGFFKIKGGKRTASAPNLDRSRSASAPMLAETERESEHVDAAGLPLRAVEADGCQLFPTSPDLKKKSKGIKKLFGKLKRSQSTTFNPDDMTDTDFKRGGTRSTSGPRLGWSRDLQHAKTDLDAPFAKWSREQVCNWLHDQGLGIYVGGSKSWITSGQTLLHASQQDLERELGIKHPLHRKKLQLALQAFGSEEEDNKGKLDYNWVTRWLDDIGLPQYKTQFDEGRVDGRMLHYMTVDDLLSLKVGSVLHHLSIKRAIQVLRINNFEANCLRRRPSDESNITPAEVSQWTNHRVMEWLRSADLAEYAPNLRGSGVHGGLMVLEPRFNVETLAMLLNIPPNKTLLRRHLATHFNLLVGPDAQQQKRETVESPDYSLLTATAKVKPRKLAFSNFGSLRKRKQDEEEYICPMELGLPAGTGFRQGNKQGRGIELRVYNEEDLDRIEQMDDSEGTVRQIGAFSEGINNLTHMLKEDELFKDLSAGSPCTSMTDEDSNV
ncbi:liprin-beta-1b isoform X1 [Carcharodon carcharias]|uniref:liprin-beta-1b isoform X1 n=1 Tax=Carcharodon carcharias TaxID=13397 RepID=UPI001B7EEEAE|nr:liprin-beta-1b isoform X1 [Carcharodon carcharias]XP_041071819.1 liprin-beta-1b isoform X1 [Carcharodon carcharias]XP_041071820.1 liprin-beta-1b isoform X1 [Carcharodon carcharias]XP_041071821.1 liprin-beta-1b isoform X1 [Carcharodon carcharias]